MSRRLVHFCKLGRSSGPPGGRPHACLKADTPHEAPTPYQRRNIVPTTATRRSTRAKTTRRAPTFKTIGVEGKAEPPTEPRVNTEIRRPTRAADLEPKHVLVAIQCRPVRQEHATGCNSMQDHPASGAPPGCSGETCSLSGETKAPTATATRASWRHATGCNSTQDHPASWAPPGCSGETCSLTGETKAPTATASRASCHDARHNWRSLPHCRRRVSSGGALLSMS